MTSNYNLYFTCATSYYFIMVGISPQGSIFLNKEISSQISTNSTPIINGLACYYGNVLTYGNIYNGLYKTAPFIAIFDKKGNLLKKKILANTNGDLYTCSILNITPEQNISFTYQNDTFNNYTVACCDSSLNEIWSRPLIFNPSYSCINLFNQGKNVTFMII